MVDQATATLITSGVMVLLPSSLGVFIAQFGAGRFLWLATTATLVLALTGLIGLATARDAAITYQWAYCSLLLGVGTCADAFTRALRARQVGWCLALLILGAAPLLASLAVFSIDVLNGTTSAPDEALAFTLLPLGPAALTVYSVRLAIMPRRPRVATP